MPGSSTSFFGLDGAAPPLQPWSALPTSTAPTSSAPTFSAPSFVSSPLAPSNFSPAFSTGLFTPSLTPSTAFTTPGSSGSPWEAASKLRLVGEVASQVPIGFEHLDGEYRKEVGSEKSRSFGWEAYSDVFSSESAPRVYKRRFGPTETSYYVGSRGQGIESGVNDMYLHLGFKAPSSLMTKDRILDAWTQIVSRHALLASSVEFNDYYDIRFRCEPPQNAAEARIKAASLLDLRTHEDGNSYLDAYLNGPRTLSDERLAYLVISTPSSSFSSDDTAAEQEYNLFLLSTHFLGDGMALHTTANEFFALLGASSTASPASPASPASRETLAPAMETNLVTPRSWGKLGWTSAQFEFNNSQSKLVGGHAFPRAKLGTRKTLVPTVSYDAVKTKRILAACKAHGVSIATAAFALSNLAYVRSIQDDEKRRNPELPCMIYSALNVRPYLEKTEEDWYHIAIGYYNIVLPSFLPRTLSPSAYFWHQAQSVKQQTTRAVKSPFLAPRTALMALERERRSIGFERADEAKRQEELAGILAGLAGLGIGTEKAPEGEKSEAEMRVEEAERIAKEENEKAAKTLADMAKKAKEEHVKDPSVRPKAPNVALMGLSMLGNLDGMYKHADYPSIKLHTLTTGSRQRPSSLLLFAYTFAGKLWFSLGYDSNGFERGTVEKWWDELLKGVDELLLEEEPAKKADDEAKA
ncbi:hypothetical protein JCM8097_003368 [Rhodosporidiobolus ruineniae]